MEIVLKIFCNNLEQAKANKNMDTSGLSDYLMNHLFWPYLRGKKIRLGDLNYDAFELHELDRLMEYVDDLEYFTNTVGRMTERLNKSIPLARTTKSFC